jgi:hypothetical protein
VEFFELLITNQNYNHLRPYNLITPDLRRTEVLELLDTPFDRIAHTIDVRHIASGRGKHNIPNIGLFLWRLQSYPLTGVTAQVVGNGQFTFNPLGLDAPLFNVPEPETEITHLAEEINVPGELRRRPLYDEFEARRRAVAKGETPETVYFGPSPVLRIFRNSAANPVDPAQTLVCDLSDWRVPAPTKTYLDANGSPVTVAIEVAVDPKLGRMTFPASVATASVLVDYSYGFSGDLGGGPYDRSRSIAALRTLAGRDALMDNVTWRAGVSKTLQSGLLGTIFSSVAAAINAWNLASAGKTGWIGTIAILDSQTYLEDLSAPAVEIPDGCQLLIFAADLPAGAVLESAMPKGQRPHLRSGISVVGRKALSGSSDTPGELILNGLLIEGDVAVAAGYLGVLRIDHCTVVMAPGAQPLTVTSLLDENSQLVLRLERSICGTIALPSSVRHLQVKESIVDGGGIAIQAPAARVDLEASTFFGTVAARMLEASNCIFTDTVMSELRQAGCVRFCYLPGGSVTPRRYRCQPDFALQNVSDPSADDAIRQRIQPAFTSHHYGQPGYAQLKLTVPSEITRGADDGAEMGAFHFLQQPQREANLRSSLDEYLRFGLEAGIFYVT